MNITDVKIDDLNAVIKIKLTPEDYMEKYEAKLAEARKQVTEPGFRPGKVPKEVLKRQFGKAVFGEVLDKVLKETSTKALEENKIKPTCERLACLV